MGWLLPCAELGKLWFMKSVRCAGLWQVWEEKVRRCSDQGLEDRKGECQENEQLYPISSDDTIRRIRLFHNRRAQVNLVQQPPASLQLPYALLRSWLHWTLHSLHLSLRWFLMARRWKASNGEEVSKSLSISYEQFPDFWQNYPSDPIHLSPALILSLWKCPAPGGLVQPDMFSSSTHQDAEFSRHLHHPPVLFHLTIHALEVITSCQIGFYPGYKLISFNWFYFQSNVENGARDGSPQDFRKAFYFTLSQHLRRLTVKQNVDTPSLLLACVSE